MHEITCAAVTATDCTGRCTSNYHVIKTKMASLNYLLVQYSI